MVGARAEAGRGAVELGSAPGGASFALLERGLHVHGVDPGAMDPRVLAYAGAHRQPFKHHAMPAAEVERRICRAPTSGWRATSTSHR